ncbi:MAG TPA: polysaccharide pyruvyl transferase family protein [Hypericibacter adhaerens]|jgi:hypothetical protein|uniref:Polysaccharide pyruvyl transferase domain-containing protein n=1 Tax=Hypericibacter adhaerens TaxID=2602016 RepID=A0A5J6N6C5_9PROT|nr:polysaccharide pyruvyl transferase family protein [Hypericibacter adhaerens]QEX24485.1 hypothetical protein FRZ61_44260 [Hypericibacter adhaerens]HWA41691.1 polysaccharide pyruvyl transferase family protein [Hypericibacter adhaerens]
MAWPQVPNIVYSSTRSWNCGDDFILYGVRRLVEAVLPEHNALIYNRNPELIMGRIAHDRPVVQTIEGDKGPVTVAFNPYDLAKPFQGHWDNSVRAGFDGSVLNACIFAGTPEWIGDPVLPLIDIALAHKLPTAYLGLGSFEGTRSLSFNELSAKDRQLLERARLITVRDESAVKLLSPLPVESRPCPSLHAARARLRRSRHPLRIALCLQGANGRNNQRVELAIRDATVALFRSLASHCDCSLILHFVEELPELTALLGDAMPIRYAYDPRDYFELYADFDLSVTTRVHGAGICAALGIPSYVVSHSARSDTAKGFLSRLIDPTQESMEDLVSRITKTDVVGWSRAILDHQLADWVAMIERMSRFFASVGLTPPGNAPYGFAANGENAR